MKVIKELGAEEFKKQFAEHRDIKYFGKNFKYRYLVVLTREEYLNLGINSSPLVPYPKKGEHPCLKDAITQFLDNPKLLEDFHSDRGISGTTVTSYLDKFKDGMTLENCFIQNEEKSSVKSNQSYYITDGMHRLTAYGVFKKLDINDYDIEVYYSTNFPLEF